LKTPTYLKRALKLTVFISLILSFQLFCEQLDSTLISDYETKILDGKSKNDSLANLIKDGNKRIEELSQKESSQLEQLNEIEETIDIHHKFLKHLTKQSDSLGILINGLKTSIDSLAILQNERRTIMIDRLRQINKIGTPDILEILLGASSADEVVKRIHYAQDLTNYDKNLLENFEEDKISLATDEEMLRMQKIDLSAVEDSRRREFSKLESQVIERQELLSSVRSEKEKWSASVDEMREAQAELTDLITALATKKEKLSVELERTLKINFKKRKGELLWPIKGAVIAPFGKVIHPEYKTVTTNKGIDISGNSGDPIFAVAPGVVEYVGRMRGYGQFIIVNHYGGFITIYAHFRDIAVKKSDLIEVEQKLGTVGESGSVNGTKLHFEIRKNSESLDPQKWLAEKF
jgi:septal ring factor EnvC (AmiA/AmiB activator)